MWWHANIAQHDEQKHRAHDARQHRASPRRTPTLTPASSRLQQQHRRQSGHLMAEHSRSGSGRGSGGLYHSVRLLREESR